MGLNKELTLDKVMEGDTKDKGDMYVIWQWYRIRWSGGHFLTWSIRDSNSDSFSREARYLQFLGKLKLNMIPCCVQEK